MADEVSTWLDEQDAPEYVREAFSGSSLRKKLEEAHTELEQLRPLQQEIESIRKAPKRESVFKELGVDFTALRKTDQHILAQYDWEGDEPDKESAAAYLQEWGIEAGGEQPSGETPPAAGVVAAAFQPGSPISIDTLDEQISAAEAKGDWNASRTLKAQRARAKREQAGI